MLYKKNECGRSMLEILAVLAIIGILSVVGLSGYRWAIQKIESNSISEGLSQSATLITAALNNGRRDLEIKNENDVEIISEASKTFLSQDNLLKQYNPVAVSCGDGFDIALSSISPDVCLHLVNSVPPSFARIDVQQSNTQPDYCLTSESFTTECGVDNDVRMIFSFELPISGTSGATDDTGENDDDNCPLENIYTDTAMECSDRCPGRRWHTYSHLCYKPVSCPPDQFSDIWGGCHECGGDAYNYEVPDADEVSCRACEPTYWYWREISEWGTCQLYLFP